VTIVLAASFHHFLETWAPLAEWAVALGTLGLASATVWLGWQAKNDAGAIRAQAAAVTRQVEIGQQQLEANQRPFVLPITVDWGPGRFTPVEPEFPRTVGQAPEPWMKLSNAGSGPAYNVSGALYWPGGIGGGWQVVPASIPAGQQLAMGLTTHAGYEMKWAGAQGYLRYTDLAGSEWLTHFRYRQNPDGQWWVEVRAAGKTTDLGQPEYSLENGWENPP
jgi:hypothetical protein